MPVTRRSNRTNHHSDHHVNKTSEKNTQRDKSKVNFVDFQVETDDKEMTTEKTRQMGMSTFPYTLPYKRLNLRSMPFLYRPGKGEQGVLMVEPYKSELLPNWTFKDPESANKSSQKLKEQFYQYVDQEDFVGADMARKFIQVRVGMIRLTFSLLF